MDSFGRKATKVSEPGRETRRFNCQKTDLAVFDILPISVFQEISGKGDPVACGSKEGAKYSLS
jgi:hypothetical protein